MKNASYTEVKCYADLGVLGEDVEVLVDFEWHRAYAATATTPAEDATIEIGKMTFWVEGTMVDATGCEALADAVEEQCWEHLRSMDDQEADYRYEQMRERRMEGE